MVLSQPIYVSVQHGAANVSNSPPPQVGFNNNVKHRGSVYHIQTEDSGVKYPHVITHLFADGGRILKSVKTSYAQYVGTDQMPQIVRELMRQQHKNMFEALREGQYDDLLDQGATSSSQPASRSASEASERSPQSRSRSSQTVPSASPISVDAVSSIAQPIIPIGDPSDVEPQRKSARSPLSAVGSSRRQPPSSAARSRSRFDAGDNKPLSSANRPPSSASMTAAKSKYDGAKHGSLVAKSVSSSTAENDMSVGSGRYSFDGRAVTEKASNEATAPTAASSPQPRFESASRLGAVKPPSSSAGSGSVPSTAIFSHRPSFSQRPSVSRQQPLFGKQADEEKSLDDIILGFLADEFGPDAVAGAAEKASDDRQSKPGGSKPRG